MSDEIEESQPEEEHVKLTPQDIGLGAATALTFGAIDIIGHFGVGGVFLGMASTVVAAYFGKDIITTGRAVYDLSKRVYCYIRGAKELPVSEEKQLSPVHSKVQEAKQTRMLSEEELDEWEEGNMSEEEVMSDDGFPTSVRYEDIRHRIPRGHVLVGIGRSGIETRDKSVGACVWIVGLSGTGKTSTTVLRVEERRADGHKFLGIDPHFFKDDSLTNAVAPYARSFLKPMGKTAEEINRVLNAFLAEFLARKSGRVPKPWQKITLLVDEVNALVDPIDKQEEENAELLKKIARICGQEARNFNMGGIFISQQATGLSWLRKVALMVIVHQLLMQSEKKIACNEDTSVMEDMKTWPIGRTYVYGIGFGKDGPRTVQQPYFEPPQVVDDDLLPNLPMKKRFLPDEELAPKVAPIHTFHLQPEDAYLQPVEPMEYAEIGDSGDTISLSPNQKEKMWMVLEMDAKQSSQNEIIEAAWGVRAKDRAGQEAAKELRIIRAYLAQEASKSLRKKA